MAYGITFKIIAILVSVILVVQIVPVDAAGSDERKKKETDSKRIQDERNNLKIISKNSKLVWEAAKVNTENAKDAWKANKTTENKEAVTTAKAAELIAYTAWKKSIQDYKNYKPKIKASEIAKQAQVISEEKKAKLDIKAKKELWDDAKKAYREAGKVYKKNKTDANYDLWKQASIAINTAETNYDCAKQILKDVRKNVAKSCSFV